MLTPDQEEFIASRVNDRSHRLIDEFRAHYAECEADGMTDKRKVFEGWAIQKIAGLQLLVEDLIASRGQGA